MEKLLTIQDVCSLLQVSRSAVYEWTHIEYIPYYKFPNGVRFKESEIERWLSKKRMHGRIQYKIEI